MAGVMSITMSRRMGTSSKGFTIVELLIVIVVIAILAAITIVSYNGITNKTKEASVLTSTAQALKKIKAYSIVNNEAAPATLADAGVTDSDGTTYQYTRSGTNGFCITSVKDSKSSYAASSYSYNSGTIVDQPSSVLGACPGHSATGGTIVRNVVPNPSFEVNTFGWNGTNASLATSTVWADSGVRSLRVTNTATTNTGDFRIAGTGLNVIPGELEVGKTYRISARLHMPAAPTGGFGRSPGVLVFISTNGSTWVEYFGPKPPAAAGTYTVSHTVAIPSNATGVIIAFGAASSTASQYFYYDSIMVTEGSTTYTYGDGTSSGWVWSGVPHESPSTGPAL